MRNDKYRKKLNSLAEKGDRGYPRAVIQFFGPSKARAKKATLKISDGKKAVFTKEYLTNGYDLKWDSSFNKEVLLRLREFNVQTLDLSNIVQGCHKDLDSDECKYWKSLPRVDEYDFGELTENGLKYKLEPDEDGNLNLIVFKPANVPGNDIYKGDGCLVEYEGLDCQTKSHLVKGTLRNKTWYYGVQSGYAPGPGPDVWLNETREFDSMKQSILQYYFSNSSAMKREPIYFLLRKLSKIAELKRNKDLHRKTKS